MQTGQSQTNVKLVVEQSSGRQEVFNYHCEDLLADKESTVFSQLHLLFQVLREIWFHIFVEAPLPYFCIQEAHIQYYIRKVLNWIDCWALVVRYIGPIKENGEDSKFETAEKHMSNFKF